MRAVKTVEYLTHDLDIVDQSNERLLKLEAAHGGIYNFADRIKGVHLAVDGRAVVAYPGIVPNFTGMAAAMPDADAQNLLAAISGGSILTVVFGDRQLTRTSTFRISGSAEMLDAWQRCRTAMHTGQDPVALFPDPSLYIGWVSDEDRPLTPRE